MTASIPSPPENGFSVGPFFVHAYGLAYVVAILAAVLIASRRWEDAGGDRHLVQEVALWGVPAGLIGGRLYFLETSWNEVPPHWWGPFAIWDGGLGIWGGIAAGTLAGLWVLRRRGADIPRFLDAAAPALLVAQAIGRIGNYFNQELFGGPTNLPWALRIDPAHRPPGYEQYATFQPTFLYELIWNLGLAGALVWLGHHRRIRPGGLFALYVAGYSGFRIFEELLRVDPAHHILGLRINLYVAAALFLAALLWFARIQTGAWPWRSVRRGAAVVLVGGALALAGCGQSSRADAAMTAHKTRAGPGDFCFARKAAVPISRESRSDGRLPGRTSSAHRDFAKNRLREPIQGRSALPWTQVCREVWSAALVVDPGGPGGTKRFRISEVRGPSTSRLFCHRLASGCALSWATRCSTRRRPRPSE